jgi:hypothetical protein
MKIILKSTFLVVVAIICGAASDQSKSKAGLPITVLVDQKQVTFEGTQPMAIKGVTMVPLRGIFEKIGAYVEYDAANHKVTAKRGNEDVELRLGDKIATKNGAEIIMEVPACIVGGSTMVPLRFVAEALGGKVSYDQPTNTVSISTSNSGFGPGGGGTPC